MSPTHPPILAQHCAKHRTCKSDSNYQTQKGLSNLPSQRVTLSKLLNCQGLRVPICKITRKSTPLKGLNETVVHTAPMESRQTFYQHEGPFPLLLPVIKPLWLFQIFIFITPQKILEILDGSVQDHTNRRTGGSFTELPKTDILQDTPPPPSTCKGAADTRAHTQGFCVPISTPFPLPHCRLSRTI